MMPTLLGRWQTRLMLFVVIVVPISLLFALARGDWRMLAPEPLILVTVMLGLGIALDIVYHQLQRLRWDQDWPFALYVIAAMFEFAAALIVARNDWLPGIDTCQLARIDRVTRELVCVDYALPLGLAIAQFAAILAVSLMFVAGIGQTIFIRWRFKGGEFGGFDAGEK